TPIVQSLQWLGKTLPDIDAEFLLKIIATSAAQLELQDELANQLFIGIGRHGAINRETARLQGLHVRLEIVLVLIVRSLQMAKGRDAQAEQIRPGPKTVAVNEPGLFLVFDSSVGAADG